MGLRDYVRKRRFDATPEPSGEGESAVRGHRPIFVIQLHHARARHYDFRLEADGVLKSWAVPKGPSLRPGEKRLAVEVEDHPVSYATFAGDIPEGNYGAGHVDIFDHGVWSMVGDPLEAIAAGKLDFELHGGRLRGGWKLVRTQQRRGSKNQWLLIKRSDDYAADTDADALAADADIGTGAAVAKTASGRRHADAVAVAKKAAPRAAKSVAAKKPSTRRAGVATWRKRALALDGAREHDGNLVGPMLCSLREAAPDGDGWLHEIKWDGYRLLASTGDDGVALRSRNNLDWSGDFPEIAAALAALRVPESQFDGELVALDSEGRSDFSALQRTLGGDSNAPLRYLLFDLPVLAGVDLRRVALVERKALLEDLVASVPDPALAFSTHIVGQGPRVFEASTAQGVEGIVCKRVDGHYSEGRGDAWVKVKHANTDEFVIVGYSAPKGSRTGFGALLMAARDNGGLRYVGRVGTGYDTDMLRSLGARLRKLARDTPTVDLPSHLPRAAGVVHWVDPELVAEVAFRGWGKEGLLRQASFQRLRVDKTVAEVAAMPATTKRATPKTVAAKKSAVAKKASAPAKRPMRQAAADTGVKITHPERVVYPKHGFTKGDVADYYRAVAPWLLPELADRPLSLVRCPDGAAGTCFFQKHYASSLGANVGAVELKEKDGDRVHYVSVHDVDGLLELVQMNVLEFHPWGARNDDPEHPDRLVFDLDPGPGVAWKDVVAGAREVRRNLADIGLRSWVRLSGGKGLHVVVPLKPKAGWDEAKAFCEAVADAMATTSPQRYVATASKAKRNGLIFIDWLRNGRGATSVTNWSLRAREGATVAVPLRWEDLGRIAGPDAFDLAKAKRRAAALRHDPWDGLASCRQTLPRLR
ncbi:DNA ligase D [Chiayiivirga flava]|uniref:DNA ligase (ATP) n=1 Tax=Chiayiivirga flava TaxID=659595 RepID=A0A7W8D848_9GAMM|nr:DNA ligase D [Chiayiivirga flava]MBB5209684.1 bifunctional non-homologous end joining protein LigD [Chiayiivirga flava]